MVPVLSLWLPILLSAAAVFVVSSLIHMVLKYHWTDFARVPDEDAVMDALGRFQIPPGNYVMPHAGSPKAMQSEAYQAKLAEGPVGFLIVRQPGGPNMGKQFVQWFLFSVLVGVFAAYIAGRALGPGAHYLAVFRFVGATAWLAYGIGLFQNSIWYGRSWSTTLKSVFDGLVYALVTAGMFGWLWPA